MITLQRRNSTRIRGTVFAAALVCCLPPIHADDTEPASVSDLAKSDLMERGEALYRSKCVSCHGEHGQGVQSKHPDPLIGDATVGELGQLIDETMPEDEPEACVNEDAAAVAEYVHFSFYSEAARLRNRPPRIELARLTGTQLRQSLADLYSHFDGIASLTDKRGLSGVYYDGARRRSSSKKFEQIDAVIDVDFGRESPGEGIEAKAFTIIWKGGLKADVTGRYEIVVRSTCSFVFNFGKIDREFINNHVQSGDKTEFRRTLMLTAGRVYPIQIEFVQRERKTEQPPALISLAWVMPSGTEQIIPTQNLLPGDIPGTFALQSVLPPDDRSYGYQRGLAVNRQWDDSTTAAAIEFAQIASDELWPSYQRRHRNDSDENRSKLRAFVSEVIETAFRSKLDDHLRGTYVDKQIDAVEDDAEAIKRSLLLALKSSRFLYPAIDSHQSISQRAANRLALTLHDSLPSDEWLIGRIDRNELREEGQIRDAARKMVEDYRTKGKTRELLVEWLNLSQAGEISKNGVSYSGFSPELVSDLRSSLDYFLDDVVWCEASDYRQLFQADWAYTSDRISQFYGESWKPVDERGPRMRRSVGDPDNRFGLLTHPYLMSHLAYRDSTSPIHRGVFLIRYMLGRTLRPPAEAFTPLAPDLHPDLTTRERVTLQTSPESCQVCHSKINGLGFALENFDSVGRYRVMEKEKPINAVGSYTTRSGNEVTYGGVRELASFLATSDDAHSAFVSRAFQHFVKQPVAAYGATTFDQLIEKFKNNGCNIRDLIVEIAVIAAMNDQALPQQDS